MSNIDALADSIERSVKSYIGERFKAFEASIADTFRKMVDALPKPKDGDDGKDADEKAIAARVLQDVTKAIDAIPAPQNGKDADPKEMRAAVQAEVERAVAALPKPEKGKDADPEFVRSSVRDEVSRAVAALPPAERGQDGKSVDLVQLSGEIMAAAAKAVAALPVPTNGRDFDPLLLKAEVEKAVALIPKPQDGRNADPVEVGRLVDSAVAKAVGALPPPADAELVHELVERAVGAIPRPQDGKSVEAAEVERMVGSQVAKAVAALPRPQDGDDGKDYDPAVLRAEAVTAARAAVAELPPPPAGKDANAAEIANDVIERVMRLVRMPADGKSVTVEDIKPLLEGEVSRWELEFERRATDILQRAVERMPRPKDGADGLGFDDMAAEQKDDRTFALVFSRDGVVKRFEFTFPTMIDRGTFKAGQSYERGDSVTYGGSMFTAQRTTTATERPEDGSGAFRLAVKRGRDGGGS